MTRYRFHENTDMTLPPWGYRVYESGSGIILAQNDETPINDFTLSQNYPNPFNPTTKIKYSILQPSNVSIKVYNPLGKEIETLVDEYKSAGSYEISFNAKNQPSGVYFYRIVSGSYSETNKMLLLK